MPYFILKLKVLKVSQYNIWSHNVRIKHQFLLPQCKKSMSTFQLKLSFIRVLCTEIQFISFTSRMQLDIKGAAIIFHSSQNFPYSQIFHIGMITRPPLLMAAQACNCSFFFISNNFSMALQYGICYIT